MRVIEEPRGRSWRVVDDHGVELGVIVLAHAGRRATRFLASYSAIDARRRRWELGVHTTMEAAVAAVEGFNPREPGLRVQVVIAHRKSANGCSPTPRT